MIKYGFVSSIDENLCRVRVNFPDEDIPSPWMPIVLAGVLIDKHYHLPGINTHVCCLMDPDFENGVVLGAIYDSSNPAPSGSNKSKTLVQFSDGSLVQYSTQNSELKIQVGTATIEINLTGIDISKGGESLKAILSDMLTQMQAETHTSSAPGSPTSPPLNLAAYVLIQARLNNLFQP
jgi:phage baseplate assembly protein V